MSTVTAPVAPGSLGDAIEPTLLLAYLQRLQTWLGTRRRELDELDKGAQASPQGPHLVGDIALSLALWQAVQNRSQLLLATWDSGRVGVAERQKLSTLIWGRLDTTVGGAAQGAAIAGMNVSLPEACRLSDALAASLRTKLQLDPDADAMAARIVALRAQLERLRDQVLLEPADQIGAAQVRIDAFARRLATISDKLARGGDIGGLIAPLEIDCATCERDLIVGSATRRQTQERGTLASQRQADLEVRAEALQKLVDQTIAAVTPAPKYAVPDVRALGEIPQEPAALDAYLARLAQVNKAMQMVQTAYGNALAEHEALGARLDAIPARPDREHEALAALCRRLLLRTPCPVPVVRALVDALSAWTPSEEAGR